MHSTTTAKEKGLAKPTAEEIESTRKVIERKGHKLRAFSQGLINRETLDYSHVPCIQLWMKGRRRYMLFSISGGWYYETDEERDRVLAALTARTPGGPTP